MNKTSTETSAAKKSNNREFKTILVSPKYDTFSLLLLINEKKTNLIIGFYKTVKMRIFRNMKKWFARW